ncbi:MAG: glycosyltransferase [Cytophagales bacterium]|nr:glycosyltransferase [Cytophagales bacterium]
MKTPQASVIVAFYNNIPNLNLVLAGFERQNFTDFEIVLADDGSNQSTVEQLNQIISNCPLRVQHVWHEDRGWRKTQILNKALKTSKGKTLIFIDGDCVPHRAFVNEHVLNTESGVFLAGRRVHLSSLITDKLTEQRVKDGYLESPVRLLLDSLHKKPRTKNAERSIYLKSSILRKVTNLKQRDLLGCNMSMRKQDLLYLNGFDERYIHPCTGEDTDIFVRLKFAGFRVKTMINTAIQYHLWHKKGERSEMEINNKILSETKKLKQYHTPYGVINID